MGEQAVLAPPGESMPGPALTPQGPGGPGDDDARPAAARDMGDWLHDQKAVRAVVRLPRAGGRTVPWPDWVPTEVEAAYRRLGVARPWAHQAAAAEFARAGRHVILATGTGSGKSAAFGMPALAAITEPSARPAGRGPTVLYLAPTKALAHDQLAGLAALGIPGLRIATLDGDTPAEDRRWARTHARWLLTNPDMLHRGVLPQHDRWRSFLRELRFIVVDEAHHYRGMFGAHTAVVLRRLHRLAVLHGARPTFIAASATLADPGMTAARLLGVTSEVVALDEAAHGEVELFLCDAGALSVGASGEARGLPAAMVMSRMVESGVRTLTFARSRRVAEAIAAEVQDSGPAGRRVMAYRGGYLPEERRALEAGLRGGSLLGLASTNALELGIDISGLDAVVMSGWPGTRASFWQQVGRAGRRGGSATAVLLAGDDPLDHYVVNHPEVITGDPIEAVVLDPANPYVLAGQLCAAASESPLLDEGLTRWFGAGATAVCQALAEGGLLRRRRDGWYWTRDRGAPDLVDLRGGGAPVRVVECATGRLLGTVDRGGAAATVHPGAIYVHQGATFEVKELDLADGVALARPILTDMATQAQSRAVVSIIAERQAQAWAGCRLAFGDVEATSQVTGFLRRRRRSGEVVSGHTLDLPPSVLRTTGVWWELGVDLVRDARIGPDELPGALHALEHAAIGMLPLLVTCDRWDLGGVSTPAHAQRGLPMIFVYDGHPGGAGFAERGFHLARTWLRATRDVIADCACEDGCPRCVQSPKCGNGNNPLDKRAATRLATTLLGPLGQ